MTNTPPRVFPCIGGLTTSFQAFRALEKLVSTSFQAFRALEKLVF